MLLGKLRRGPGPLPRNCCFPRKRAEEISQISADIQSAVEELRADYGVSREIAIRQIDNARPSLSPQQSAELERMVSSLERF